MSAATRRSSSKQRIAETQSDRNLCVHIARRASGGLFSMLPPCREQQQSTLGWRRCRQRRRRTITPPLPPPPPPQRSLADERARWQEEKKRVDERARPRLTSHPALRCSTNDNDDDDDDDRAQRLDGRSRFWRAHTRATRWRARRTQVEQRTQRRGGARARRRRRRQRRRRRRQRRRRQRRRRRNRSLLLGRRPATRCPARLLAACADRRSCPRIRAAPPPPPSLLLSPRSFASLVAYDGGSCLSSARALVCFRCIANQKLRPTTKRQRTLPITIRKAKTLI